MSASKLLDYKDPLRDQQANKILRDWHCKDFNRSSDAYTGAAIYRDQEELGLSLSQWVKVTHQG